MLNKSSRNPQGWKFQRYNSDSTKIKLGFKYAFYLFSFEFWGLNFCNFSSFVSTTRRVQCYVLPAK